MNVEAAVLGFPSLIVCTVSVGKATLNERPVTELRSCVKVEVAVMGSPSLISLMVSVDVRQLGNEKQAGHLPR